VHHTATNDPPRILLAEDDEELRDTIAAVLRGDGYDVIEADGARLPLHIAAAHTDPEPQRVYDLIVAGVHTRGCTGLHIIEGLRQAGWATPAILLVPSSDMALRERAVAAGATVVPAPFDAEDVEMAVMDLVPWDGPVTRRPSDVPPSLPRQPAGQISSP
jgi:CheY-like chemotaxis protein